MTKERKFGPHLTSREDDRLDVILFFFSACSLWPANRLRVSSRKLNT